MGSTDTVIIISLPGSGIIPNKSRLLNSHMVHAQCLKFLQMYPSGIANSVHSIIQDIRMFSCSFWTHLISMPYTLLVFIQSETRCGNTLFAMTIAFRSLMNCISCSWVQLKTYCTGCSNTWKLELSRMNFTIDFHGYHDIWASTSSLKDLNW